MSREEYLGQVIRLYLQAPDAPRKARKADWAIATTFYRRGIPLADVEHAIYLASLRRHRRGLPLTHEPICSLAYFRPVLEQLQNQPHDPDYVDYIRWTYRRYFDEMVKSAARRQNTALLDRR